MTTSRIASTKQRVHSIITMNTSVSVSTATQVLLMFCSVIVDHLISVYSLFGNCQLLKLTYIKSVYMCVTRLSYFVAKDKKSLFVAEKPRDAPFRNVVAQEVTKRAKIVCKCTHSSY